MAATAVAGIECGRAPEPINAEEARSEPTSTSRSQCISGWKGFNSRAAEMRNTAYKKNPAGLTAIGASNNNEYITPSSNGSRREISRYAVPR
jgi:hypothetical protein